MRSTHDWIATDLDGTLLARNWAGEDAVPGTWKGSGDTTSGRVPSSWIPGSHYRLVSTLALYFDIVPVTARDLNSFLRVSIDGISMEGVAVLSNGGLILNNEGNVDEEWCDLASEITNPWISQLTEFHDWLLQREINSLRARIVEGAHDMPSYVVAKSSPEWWTTLEAQDLLAQATDWSPLLFSLHKNELQALTPVLNKKIATEFVLNKYYEGKPPLLSLGDMPADVGFMQLASFMAMPKDSSLSNEKLIENNDTRFE